LPAKHLKFIENTKLKATIVGKLDELKEAVKSKPTYLIESDFLDDPKRPGAVIPPWSIQKNWKKIIKAGQCSLEYALKVNVDNVKEHCTPT